MKWYLHDKSNVAGEALITTAGYNHLINKTTYCVNGNSSCIDLIFTSNANLVTDFGVGPTRYEKCRHDLIFGKINFNIHVPPPFYRDIWVYKIANVEMIQTSIIDFNWKRTFSSNSCK